MQCEHCQEQHDFEASHSMIAVLQKVDQAGYTFFQCEEAQEYNGVRWQHYHCSHDHMVENFASCIIDHYSEEKLHPIPPGGGTTNIHRIVLKAGLSCKVCSQPLEQVAYRFCLTRCTPVNAVPDGSLDPLANWTCSLEHAQAAAHIIIANLEEL
jgi:hypothetical protein